MRWRVSEGRQRSHKLRIRVSPFTLRACLSSAKAMRDNGKVSSLSNYLSSGRRCLALEIETLYCATFPILFSRPRFINYHRQNASHSRFLSFTQFCQISDTITNIAAGKGITMLPNKTKRTCSITIFQLKALLVLLDSNRRAFLPRSCYFFMKLQNAIKCY